MASIMKKSERKYKITVSNGYRADGRKISKAKTITVPDSVPRRSISQYVIHAAEEMEREVKNGYSEDGETTFQEYADHWLSRQVKYAPSTRASYERMLQRVYPYIGAVKVKDIRPIALENMLTELRKWTRRGKPIQETTVQKYLTVVSAVLSDAKRNEIIQKNPARMIDLPDTEHREQFIPTPEQAKEFLDGLVDEPWQYKVYYLLAVYTGCRRGELCALKWSDFIMDGDRCILTVSRSRSIVAGEGVREGPTKNGKSRIMVIDSDVTSLLKGYCYYQIQTAQELGYESGEYLFTDDFGNLIHPDTFTKHLRKIYEELGFPSEFHLHTLRHYFVTTLLHSGVDKQTVAELAGHGDTSFLERTYCHPQMELKRHAAEIMTQSLLAS